MTLKEITIVLIVLCNVEETDLENDKALQGISKILEQVAL